MPYTPASGDVAKVTVGAIDLPATNWKLDIDGNAKDASNFRDGRATKNTLVNVTLTATAIWDTTLQMTDALGGGIKVGNTATIKCYTDAAKFFSGSYTITKTGPENKGVEDLVTMDFTAMIQGTLTYPV